MQDKEFDKLFHSKFEDFKIEPSPMVWDNITDELDGKKAKRSIMPWLSIAASVIILVTAGVLFLQQKNKVTKQQVNNNQVAANHIQPAATTTDKRDAAPIVPTPPAADKIVSTVTTSASPVNKVTASVNSTDNIIKEAAPVKADNQPLIAAVTAPEVDVIQATVPDKGIQLVPKSVDIEQQARVEKPAIMASVNKPDAVPVKKRGIHSLGGLINVLIAKVDKRQDKLIEFSDNDDDNTESNVTGVNLGIIKIKKQ